MSIQLRPRRLFVSGGSRLSPQAARLWREVGRLLAAEKGLVVITGGLAGRDDSPDAMTADRAVVDGVLSGLDHNHSRAEHCIETVLPDSSMDFRGMRRFREGSVRVLHHRTAQSRRFSMVYDADVVVSIEGDHGTRSVLDVALALGRPVLPLPFGGGASEEFWGSQTTDIRERFQLTEVEYTEFTAIRLEDLGNRAIGRLAARVHTCLMRGFTRTCFVIMPFRRKLDRVYDKAICPALKAHGLLPMRTDKHVFTGNVIAAIRDGLRHCFFAIADTTGDRPNVMYELGMAHAGDKPVILLRRASKAGELVGMPFDLQTESIISYGDDMAELSRRLQDVIGMICRGPRDADCGDNAQQHPSG